MNSSRICALPDDVINKIAAGEVIQRPSSVVKEMLENALDAGSANISISIKNGGFKLIHVQDDGHGVIRDDLDLLCQRFATSKLRAVEDLLSIGTYGFRGEALASVSFVAELSVVTKTQSSPCGYKVSYKDGNPTGKPMPLASTNGTAFTVENLFHNMPTRRSALHNQSDEYMRILDVVTRYAVHNPHAGMSLKKAGEMCLDLRTQGKSTVRDNIGILYGMSILKGLMELAIEDKDLALVACGYLSSLNHTGKKTQFLLFINDRLVESQPLRRAVEQAYAVYLIKGVHPFVYLSLKIAPNQVDVNVHPTKSEVQFLNHDEIVDRIASEVAKLLAVSNESRPFPAKTVTVSPAPRPPNIYARTPGAVQSSDRSGSKRPYEHELVRSDAKERKLDSFLVKSPLIPAVGIQLKKSQLSQPDIEVHRSASDSSCVSKNRIRTMTNTEKRHLDEAVDLITPNLNEAADSNSVDHAAAHEQPERDHAVPAGFERKEGSLYIPCQPSTSTAPDSASESTPESVRELFKGSSEQSAVDWRPIRLRSVLAMQQTVCSMIDPDARQVIKEHSFVGCVNPRLCLLQSNTSLYLVDTQLYSWYYFYQTVAFGFGNFGVIRLSQPIPVLDAVLMALDQNYEGPWSDFEKTNLEIAVDARQMLSSKSPMLWDYFSIELTQQDLLALPLLLSGYAPQLESVGHFFLDLAFKVDWTAEQACFESIAEVLAGFYQLQPGCGVSICFASSRRLSSLSDWFTFQQRFCHEEMSSRLASTPWLSVVEHVLLPAFRSRLLPPKVDDGALTRLTALRDLYRVFERC